ncbi:MULTISPECIES: D-TA family PLP-dependent enzyme [Rhizobium/Agrobacterium group]|uniref:D-TA family PLP-dependent enzyme n=1 Tax=Rhizobium/Agrobacterium group TaxID=227290 RepID=UPI000B3F8313|nr:MULTISPECIES: D-TA family PLP-dependent enzyme [Rhizobium/Agrobacterium group]MCF1480649.1 D-TA family PLP-dependent enzyme [Allorhizobium ampelinum]NSZ44501.1 D-TA family PLP-dependent enzyme [Agrobacterium vitis]NTA28248.1 D-TA family PLP-dependent enzyme [Allorhizobium ampelinum]OVE92892.1 alanine racemase [Allorhizobium ampelinum]
MDRPIDIPGPRPGDPVLSLSTPLPLIDEDRLAANIARVQSYMDVHSLAFRPHIKTHKIPPLARQQQEAGATGINCQKITEAEVFAEAGFEDILITFNILGPEKLVRLAALNEQISGLKVVADSIVTVEGLASYFADRKPLSVLVECDTGAGRCGVQTPADAVGLAQAISASKGLRFGGIMTYPKAHTEQVVESFFAQILTSLTTLGITCPIVSNGGTPSLFSAHLVPSATEHRAGTYIYSDRSMAKAGHGTLEDCAMHILATVVSRPTPDRAILDAGSKALTSDLLGFSDYGLIVDYPDAVITGLSEEHGTVDLSKMTGKRPEIGEKVRIIPNHTCVVSNLFDIMTFHRNGVVTRVEQVAARGLVW